MSMWAGFILFCLVAILWLAVAAAAEKQLKRRGYISMSAYAAYIQFMQDKKELNRLGIAQQLKRVFGPFAAFGISLNAMSLLWGSGPVFHLCLELRLSLASCLGLACAGVVRASVPCRLGRADVGGPDRWGELSCRSAAWRQKGRLVYRVAAAWRAGCDARLC